jgi:hypothetical protein
MKNLFIINEEEKNRILNLHETATKRQYLSEQSLDLGQSSEPTQPVTTVPTLLDSGAIVKQGLPPDPYVYAKLGDDYYYSKDVDSDNPNWKLAKNEKSINAIKGKIYNEKIPVKKKITPPKKEDNKKPPIPKKEDDKKSNVVLSKKISPTFKTKINTSKLSTSHPVDIFKAGQNNCATFVHQFVDGLGDVGHAWIAYDNSRLGNTIMSSFNRLNSNQIDSVTDLWKDINKSGGGKEKGQFNDKVFNIVNKLVPKTPNVSLKLNDIVGIFYPGSGHHEEAFYDAGKGFFKKNMLGMTVNGETIKKGIGWGMNTHIGVVGAIKDGVPIVFHNIGGQVWADPYNNLKGDSRIAWVKRA